MKKNGAAAFLLILAVIFSLAGCGGSLVGTQAEYERTWDFYNGLAVARVYRRRLFRDGFNMYGYINESGEWAIPPRFVSASDFRYGAAVVFCMENVADFSDDHLSFGCAVIDKEGNFIVEPGRFLLIMAFMDGEAMVSSVPPIYGGEVVGNIYGGIIDTTGAEIVPVSMGFNMVLPFIEGYASVMNFDYEWGAINRDLEIVIPLKFDNAIVFQEGVSRAGIDGIFGFIDTGGEWVVPPQFERANNFSDGIARVMLDGEWFYIDRTGAVIDSNTH